MLDELAKRKPELVERDSVRVVFGDGQAWAIPKPWLEIRPIFKNRVARGSYRALAYGPPIDDLVEVIKDLGGDVYATAVAVATAAAALLRRNYDLTDAELDQLLNYRPDDVSTFQWVGHVVEIAAGMHGRVRGSEETDG